MTNVVKTAIEPPPLKSPMFDENGTMTRAWQVWFSHVQQFMNAGVTGTFLDHASNTVHVQNGKIVSLT